MSDEQPPWAAAWEARMHAALSGLEMQLGTSLDAMPGTLPGDLREGVMERLDRLEASLDRLGEAVRERREALRRLAEGGLSDTLHDALEAHQQQFGHVIALVGIPPSRHAEVELRLRAAVHAGEALTNAGLRRGLGMYPGLEPDPEPAAMDDADLPPDPDAFQAAVNRYGAAFPDEGLPFMRTIEPADWPLVIALLDDAVAAGTPLDAWAIMAALGIHKPDDDGDMPVPL